MPTPIETMLNAVEWEVLPPDIAAEREKKFRETGIPYATHEGKLMIGDIEFNCAQLNTGQAVITEESMNKILRVDERRCCMIAHIPWGSIIWLPITIVAVAFLRVTWDLWRSRKERR